MPAEDATTESNVLSTVTEHVVPRSRTPQMEVDRSEDAVLVARLRGGDESAFAGLVTRGRP